MGKSKLLICVLVVSGCYFLRDEGLAYAEKLRQCGVPIHASLRNTHN